MSDIKLKKSSSYFDIDISNGDISKLDSLEESYTQCGNLAIMTRKGTNAFHETLGNDLFNDRVKTSETDRIEMYCIDAILSSSEDISAVDTLNVDSVDWINGDVSVDFSLRMSSIGIETEFEDEENIDVDLFDQNSDIFEFE